MPGQGNSRLPAPGPASPAVRGWESCIPGEYRSRTAEGLPPESRREGKECAIPRLPPSLSGRCKKGPAGPPEFSRRQFQRWGRCWGESLAWLGIYLEDCSINAGNFLAKSKLPVVCRRGRPNDRVLVGKGKLTRRWLHIFRLPQNLATLQPVFRKVKFLMPVGRICV